MQYAYRKRPPLSFCFILRCNSVSPAPSCEASSFSDTLQTVGGLVGKDVSPEPGGEFASGGTIEALGSEEIVRRAFLLLFFFRISATTCAGSVSSPADEGGSTSLSSRRIRGLLVAGCPFTVGVRGEELSGNMEQGVCGGSMFVTTLGIALFSESQGIPRCDQRVLDVRSFCHD